MIGKYSDKLMIIATFAIFLFSMIGYALPEKTVEFHSAWPKDVERIWVGQEYWANRLQDWRIKNGRLECTEGSLNKPMRTVHLLTYSLSSKRGEFVLTVKTGILNNENKLQRTGWTGFLIGAGEGKMDYRGAALVHCLPGKGGGIIAAVETNGRAVFRDMEASGYAILASANKKQDLMPETIKIRLMGNPSGKMYDLELVVTDAYTNKVISKITLKHVDPARLIGNIALVSHPGYVEKETDEENSLNQGYRFWFQDWTVSGSKIKDQNYCKFGPVLATQYTLHKKELKLTAQFPPLGDGDSQKAYLEIRSDKEQPWIRSDEKRIIIPGRTAGFVVKNWNDSLDWEYRVVYPLKQSDGSRKDTYYKGIIRHNPVEKSVIRVAAFTGNMNMYRKVKRSKGKQWADTKMILTPVAIKDLWTYDNVWFPHAELVRHVDQQHPDLLFFSGDQIYEGVPTQAERTELDYLYKWYLWCWAFRDLTKDIPTITIPDDHDIYQGNLWGAGGRHCGDDISDGGYQLTPQMVNMIQRTQTNHLPDPYDPTPVQQGIGVYYTDLIWGGISFAVIEDRKFKSGPAILPDDIPRQRGAWISQEVDDMSKLDVPEAKLLGDRQLRFLQHWTADWSGGVQMKVLLSQTNFNSVHTRPDHKLARDLDKNAWPQTGRNKAVDIIRRGFAVHICGDQHLGSTIHYGVEEWEDASVAFCVPSIAVGHQRVWEPAHPGENHKNGMPDYTGRYFDAFGNRMTVIAAASPIRPDKLTDEQVNRPRAELYRRRSGYGIIDFDKQDRKIIINCWPRQINPQTPNAKQFIGWPIVIDQMDNYGLEAVAFLPTLKVTNLSNPVVQIIDVDTADIIYTIRINGSQFRPKVFKQGYYTIRIGDPDVSKIKIIENIHSLEPDEDKVIEITF